MQRIIMWMPICLLVAGLAGCVSMPGMDMIRVRVSKERPFLIAKSTNSMGWGFFSHPSIIRLLDKDLVLFYYLGGDSAGKSAPDEMAKAGPAVSSDNGQTWKKGPDQIRPIDFKALIRIDNESLGVISATNGFYYFGKVFFGANSYSFWHYPDGRVERNEGVLSLSSTNLVEIGTCHRGVELANGDLLIPGYAYDTATSNYASYLYRSTDRGRSFVVNGVIAGRADAPWSTCGPSEVEMLRLPDGKLLCVSRTSCNDRAPLLQSISEDDGKTWRHRELSLPGNRPSLCRLENGIIALGHGGPGLGNSVTFSADNGRSWGRTVQLTGAESRTSGYCDVIAIDSNRLMAVYDLNDSDPKGIWLWEPKEVNGVFGVFMDVKRWW